jgi:hypothetical protein
MTATAFSFSWAARNSTDSLHAHSRTYYRANKITAFMVTNVTSVIRKPWAASDKPDSQIVCYRNKHNPLNPSGAHRPACNFSLPDAGHDHQRHGRRSHEPGPSVQRTY